MTISFGRHLIVRFFRIGKTDLENGTCWLIIGQPDLGMVPIGYFLYNKQTQASALGSTGILFAHAVELFKHQMPLAFRNTNPLITDFQLCIVAISG